jgi:hypothetical protein
LPLLEAFQRQLDVRIRRVLRFLDESVEQYHLPSFNREERSCNSIVQRRPNFPNRSPQMIDTRLADRPFELNVGNVLANGFSLLLAEAL